MAKYDKRFGKGLFKDTAHIDQPEGSWRHARNMLLNETEGAVSNEGGTKLGGFLEGDISVTGNQDSKVIGKIEVNNDRIILFVLVQVGTNSYESEIGIWEKGKYKIVYHPTVTPTIDLNFSGNSLIEGTFKIDSKGDLIIYWTDDLNPPRAFNVDRQVRSLGSLVLYGITTLSSINLLNLFPYSGKIPTIKLGEVFDAVDPTFQTSVVAGGGLLTGAYHLALAYVDVDNVATSYLTVSPAVSIVAEFDATRPTTKKDGDKEGTQTSKSISWQILDVNSDYKYIRPVVVRKMGDATEAYRLNDIEIELTATTPSTMSNIVFSSLENVSPASIEDVIIDTVSYETAKTIEQLDGILYLGNLTGSKDVGFQKYANNIKLSAKIYEIDDFDEYWATADGLHTGFANSPVDEGNQVLEDRSYRYIPNATNYKGYQRDEVYAFYLAFIMNDGSMSYAYHIPGRESLTYSPTLSSSYFNPSGFQSNTETGEAPSNLVNSYAKTAKNYQFYDPTTFMSSSATRRMQYWENQNEIYPTNENYEVWGSTNTQIGDIKGDPVRHHHFPSNENEDMCTVWGNDDSTVTQTVSDFSPTVAPVHFQGTFRLGVGDVGKNNGGAWGVFNLGTTNSTNPNANSLPTPANNITSQTIITSSDNTTISINPGRIAADNDAGGATQWAITVQLRPFGGGWGTMAPTNTNFSQCPYNSCSGRYIQFSGNELQTGLGFAGGCDEYVTKTDNYNWVIPVALAGGEVRIRRWINNQDTALISDGRNSATDPNSTFSSGNWDTCDDDTCRNHIRVRIAISSTTYDLTDYNDVQISQRARALGFNLQDIHIPQTIADKVQGFRIFRAKRDHSNRTILGQSVGVPMKSQIGIIGLCQEAAVNLSAMQNLGVKSGKDEYFFNKNPWAEEAANYPNGYEAISFHDFYLLRTKNSLAPATHLKIEYTVNDYTWNGPDIEQDKKMLTEITTTPNTTTGAYEVKERWGWDDTSSTDESEFSNCYPQYANSAIFIGGLYVPGSSFSNTMELNRALGQKAKSYIKGDSIFSAESLGFGGKVVNLGGESTIILGLADNSEIPAAVSIPDSGTVSPNQYFGLNWFPGAGPLLVGQSGGSSVRHQSYILNLKAYKTDVYKSIDSNELVFTGFEVKGEDLNNFIIGGDYNSASADFTTNTVQSNSDSVLYKSSDNRRGIFGGDIFLSRYGFASALSPLNTETLSNPLKAVYSHIVESTDNIAFRHAESKESEYFPNTPAREMLKTVGTEKGDFTHQDNIKYNANYSTDNDIKPAFPLPVNDADQDDFPTRTHRSAKNDTTSLIDNYRIFLANQFKDLPKNRGELWKLSTFSNLLYFHMEDSLFAAKGKQSMSMKDGSEAFVGSGDIFQQDPDEVIQTEDGYGGTQSQYAALSTKYGYFFVNSKSKKIFLMKDKLQEISRLSINTWFEDNISFEIDKYLAKRASTHYCLRDNSVLGFGFHSVYDPKHKRIILTKREKIPTQAFIDGYEEGLGSGPPPAYYIEFNESLCTYVEVTVDKNPPYASIFTPIDFKDKDFFTEAGWTISYYPELNIWGSFHDYIPYFYFNTSDNFYSLTNQYLRPVWNYVVPPLASSKDYYGTTYGNAGIWEHNSTINYGVLYQENDRKKYTDEEWKSRVNYYPFEFEFIHNELKSQSNLLFNFEYTADVYNNQGINTLQNGFTSYFLYNSFQISGESILEYLINTRYIGSSWKINNFRDMAAVVDQTGSTGTAPTTGLNIPNTSTYYMSTNPNVIGGINTGTLTTSTVNNMFIYNIMYKDINPLYLDLTKSWDQKRKFIDKWVGIRLIYDNITNNLLNLYSTSVATRKASR